MSRSAVDATRFTATSPHAYSKPSALRASASNTFSPSSIPRSRPFPGTSKTNAPPPNPKQRIESPIEKVARLRAERAARMDAQVSTWDKVVVRGRVWADRAHRFTTMSLITFTVIAGVVTTFALGDMVIHNRRKRRSFYEEQFMLLQQRLVEAKAAEVSGTADEDQMLLLNRERAADEAEAARKARKGIWGSIKGVFGTEGLRKEDTGGATGFDMAVSERLTNEVTPDTAAATEHEGAIDTGRQIKSHEQEMAQGTILSAIEGERRRGERRLEEMGVAGGPLDRLPEKVEGTSRPVKSWFPWR